MKVSDQSIWVWRNLVCPLDLERNADMYSELRSTGETSFFSLLKSLDFMSEIKTEQPRTEAQVIADMIHEKHCKGNHQDWCGYLMETWEDPEGSKKRYQAIAEDMLKLFDYKSCFEMLRNMDSIKAIVY